VHKIHIHVHVTRKSIQHIPVYTFMYKSDRNKNTREWVMKQADANVDRVIIDK
jgi:hypothetical protein